MRILVSTILISLILSSCANQQFSRKAENPYHTPSTSTEFIQGQIPAWANSSAMGSCKREANVVYLEFSKIHQSYDMSYKEIVRWQYLFNLLSKQKQGTGMSLPEQVRSAVFYESRNKTMSRLELQKYPQFDTLHVVWVDPLLHDPEALLRFQGLKDDPEFSQGYPVFVSDCLSHDRLNGYLDEIGWQGMSRYVLGAEAFSYFKNDFSPLYQTGLFLGNYFSDRKVVLYGPENYKLDMFLDVENKKFF